MKKIEIIAICFLLVPAFVTAQQERPDHKIDSSKTKQVLSSGGHLVTFSQMDQRKIYHWGNGQRSTPTGREAGETVPRYVRLFGTDSAVVVWHPFKKA